MFLPAYNLQSLLYLSYLYQTGEITDHLVAEFKSQLYTPVSVINNTLIGLMIASGTCLEYTHWSSNEVIFHVFLCVKVYVPCCVFSWLLGSSFLIIHTTMQSMIIQFR